MTAFKVTARSGISFIVAMLILLAPYHAEAAPPVQVTAADPASAPQGTANLDVEVSGSGFDNSAAVSFLVTETTNPGGITVKNVRFIGPKKLVVTIDVADTATVALFDIEVRLSGGRKGKGTTLFAVQKAGSASAINPAFAVDPQSKYKDKVARIDADGAGLATLSGPLIWPPQPRWSPDGQSIFYFDRLPMLYIRMDSRSGGVQATLATEPHGLPEGHDWSNGSVGTCGDLIVYSAARELRASGDREYDLFVTTPALGPGRKLITNDDVDDASVGNEGDADTYFPVWSTDGKFISALSHEDVSGSLVKSVVLYSIGCTSGLDVSVLSETTLSLPFGLSDPGPEQFSWNASGRYLAMTVHTSADADLWIADLGDPSEPGYPDATPTLFRLTGTGRPFGDGPERVMSSAFTPTADTIAFVTQASGSDRNDSLYTINAGACIAALGGVGSVSTACAATLISRGINAYHVDWRPNWPTPLQ